jgi:hypothetical protein
MEFSDIKLTKDWSLLIRVIHSPFYLRMLKKTILYSGFNNPYKKSAKQENSGLQYFFLIAFCTTEIENLTKTRVREVDYAQKPGLKMLFKNSISGLKHFKSTETYQYAYKLHS